MRILCLDISAIHRANYEIAKRDSPAAAEDTTLKAITNFRDGWDVVVAVFDAKIEDAQGPRTATSFRVTIDQGYKASRTRAEPIYYVQLDKIRDRLSRDGAHTFVAPQCHSQGVPTQYYVEADDVIGWVAHEYTEAAGTAIGDGEDPGEWALRIVSSDRDLFQLIDDELSVTVLSPVEHTEYRTDQVIEKFGVPPVKVPQYKALAGDASDGYKPYPGALIEGSDRRGPGIGEAAAKGLLTMFSGDALAAVRACVADPPPVGVKPNIVKVIRANGVIAAEKGLAMAKLCIDLPLHFEPVLLGPLPARPTEPTTRYTEPTKQYDEKELANQTTIAASAGVKAAETRDADAHKRAKETLIAWCVNNGVPPLRIDIAVAELKERVALVTKKEPSVAPSQESLPTWDDVKTKESTSQSATVVPIDRVQNIPKTVEPPEVIGEPVPPKPAHVPTSQAMVRIIAGAPLDIHAFEPRDLAELETYAEIAVNSGCYSQFTKKEQAMVALIEARERGISLGSALRNAYIVKGKLAWSASMLAALVRTSGLCKMFKITETTPTKCVIMCQRTDDPAPFPFEVTIEEARNAGWIKSDSKWQTNPRTMLRWFAKREAARAYWDEVVAGLATPDELRVSGEVTDAELIAELAAA